jgi:hypothetical protein
MMTWKSPGRDHDQRLLDGICFKVNGYEFRRKDPDIILSLNKADPDTDDYFTKMSKKLKNSHPGH